MSGQLPSVAEKSADSRSAVIRGRLLVFAAIVVAALTLRLAVTSFTPLANQIRAELGFSSTVVGVFGMVPTAMFAAFGLATPMIARRLGLEWTVLVAMLMAGVGMLARATVHDTWSLLVLSAVALGGMGIGNVVIPPLVKRYFPDRLALMSTLYIVGVQVGTVAPALVAVPVAQAYGWRVSIGMWALLGFAAAAPWVVVLAHGRGTAPEHTDTPSAAEPRPGRVWRTAVGWGMAGMFGMTSLITYSMFTWIPDILTDAGASASFGGSMVALFALVGLIAALGAPALCARVDDPFPLVLTCGVCFAIGFAGLYFAPMSAPILWITILGLGPSTFPMALTLINLRTRTHAGSAALSGFAQGLGYTVACLGPFLFGVLRNVSGGWGVPFAFLAVVVVFLVTAARQACRPRMLEDGWDTVRNS